MASREREDVALLERDVEPLAQRELARRLKGLRGEVEAPHPVPPPGQEPAVVAAAAAEDGHPPQRRGGPREVGLEARARTPEVPAVVAARVEVPPERRLAHRGHQP